jgi:hypothetical protein
MNSLARSLLRMLFQGCSPIFYQKFPEAEVDKSGPGLQYCTRKGRQVGCLMVNAGLSFVLNYQD